MKATPARQPAAVAGRLPVAVAGLALLAAAPAGAGNFALGVTLNASAWGGDNGPGRSLFDSDRGGQGALALKYSDGGFYTGIDLQGGEYRFLGAAPDRFTAGGALASSNTRVRHDDFSLLAGYYFWPRLSLFASLKSATSEWREDGYRQTFGGLGFGVAGFHPLDDGWLLFGSLGVVGGGVEDGDGRRVGDGASSALAAGAAYRLGDGSSLNFGLKLRGFEYEFDDGNRQRYSLNGLFFGFQHQFD